MMRANSHHKPERSSANPARWPATLNPWQGLPPASKSHLGTDRALTWRTSVRRVVAGQWRARTPDACWSISTCATHDMPARSRPRSIPPTPEKRLMKFMVSVSVVWICRSRESNPQQRHIRRMPRFARGQRQNGVSASSSPKSRSTGGLLFLAACAVSGGRLAAGGLAHCAERAPRWVSRGVRGSRPHRPGRRWPWNR